VKIWLPLELEKVKYDNKDISIKMENHIGYYVAAAMLFTTAQVCRIMFLKLRHHHKERKLKMPGFE